MSFEQVARVRPLADQGFEETTVDQIVAAVGMSRRTFSRYFDSKEDVVVHTIAEAAERMCAELSARPADEPSAMALRRAVSVLTCPSVDNTDKMLRQIRLILDTPALPARYLERQSQWQAEITGILARRTGLDAGADLRPALAAGVALAAVQTALSHWADSGGTKNMDELADQAFALVAPALALATDAS
ncbi:acyl-CoA-like ligand-binding transcription factor [Streptomyces prunicolor]|uniref:acyl-CoA-like ligand-binding transcription factor n=1 Tax=Streptomyces prunicolor TaxID=67348 RepID=UPI0003A55C0B|nr:TetR family transcriptional regulator [Streptomyces prunicolor]